ncbi:MAG: hypothetical protein Q8L75_07955 [Acidobacteriota bacterium]|nr:hypothetical protein [Acidobacteriota bacterium]
MARPSRTALTLPALVLFAATVAARQSATGPDLAAVLQRVGERVEQYFTRAQSIVCIEIVGLMPFDSGGPSRGRTVESELRLSWEPTDENPIPIEARTLRQVLKVNGHAPRKNDRNNCTGPEQNTSEIQPLSLLLPQQRHEYSFKLAGAGKVDNRAAILVDYRMVAKPTVTVELVDGNEDCLSYTLDGGLRGRVWIDAETYDVLRMDQGLIGLVDIPLPRKIANRDRWQSWTMERWDTSIRFKPVTFQDPPETLVLPASSTSFRITRGSGMPRLRTSTEYSGYRRFITGGRVLPPQ